MSPERLHTLLGFCVLSLVVHVLLVLQSPPLVTGSRPGNLPVNLEVTLSPAVPRSARQHIDRPTSRLSPGTHPGNRDAGRHGRQVAQREGGGRTPSPHHLLAGKDGAPVTSRPPDELLQAGGVSGSELPRSEPTEGGGGREVLAAPQLTRDPLADEKPGAGGSARGGIGFADAPNAVSRPVGIVPLALLRRAAGTGLGTGSGSSLGSAPARGAGTGADLPGTESDGQGYGRGDGIGVGSGHGVGDRYSSGNGRGVPFGDSAGLLRGGGHNSQGEIRGSPFSGRGSGAGGQGPIRVVYLLDVSQSMREGDKLGQAKHALKKALSELRPTDSFNIVYFYEDIYAFGETLAPATPGRLERGRSFIEEIGLGPGTNLSGALDWALQQKDATDIFVMSDGEPNRGVEDPVRLRKMIQASNKHIRARISTLALGLGEHFKGMELLRGLAEDNGGTFRYVDLSMGAKEK